MCHQKNTALFMTLKPLSQSTAGSDFCNTKKKKKIFLIFSLQKKKNDKNQSCAVDKWEPSRLWIRGKLDQFEADSSGITQLDLLGLKIHREEVANCKSMLHVVSWMAQAPNPALSQTKKSKKEKIPVPEEKKQKKERNLNKNHVLLCNKCNNTSSNYFNSPTFSSFLCVVNRFYTHTKINSIRSIDRIQLNL